MSDVAMSGDAHISIEHENDVVFARQKGRELAVQAGFSGSDPTLVATAISEIARNILVYAKRGRISLSSIAENGRQGVLVVATDKGPGIPDISQAMQDGFSTGRSLGLGLPGAQRLMDEFNIISAVGSGTTVTMKKWVQ